MFAYEISTGAITCIAGDANVSKDARIFDGTVIYESINGGVRIVDVYTNNSYSISDFSVNKIGAIFGNTAVVKNRDTKRPHGFKINLDIHGQGDWIDFSCDVLDKMEMYEDYTLWVDNYNSIYVPSDIRILHNTTIYNAVPTVTNIQNIFFCLHFLNPSFKYFYLSAILSSLFSSNSLGLTSISLI